MKAFHFKCWKKCVKNWCFQHWIFPPNILILCSWQFQWLQMAWWTVNIEQELQSSVNSIWTAFQSSRMVNPKQNAFKTFIKLNHFQWFNGRLCPQRWKIQLRAFLSMHSWWVFVITKDKTSVARGKLMVRLFKSWEVCLSNLHLSILIHLT